MPENYIQLSLSDADKLLACADGTAALLWLHVKRMGALSLSAAARDLKCSEDEVRRACDTLRRLGLLPPEAAPLPSHELPEYTAADVAQRARTDGAFEGLVQETQRVLGRVLSSSDLKTLFGIYDHLGLPADVTMLLLHHCIEEYQRRTGAGRLPTMRSIEKEAWYWAEREIITLDAAEEHIARERERQDAVGKAAEALQLRVSELLSEQRNYIESWLAMGFGPEAIAIAYERTVMNTGKRAWKYMNKILCSWDERKLYTPEEIEAGDPRTPAKKPAAAPKHSDSDKIEQMQKMYEHLKGKGK